MSPDQCPGHQGREFVEQDDRETIRLAVELLDEQLRAAPDIEDLTDEDWAKFMPIRDLWVRLRGLEERTGTEEPADGVERPSRSRLPDDWPPVLDATPELLRFQVKEAGRLLYLAAIADDDGLDEDDRYVLSVIRENVLPEAGWRIGEHDRLSGDDALGILLAWHEVAALLPDGESVTPLWYAARALRLAVWLLGYDPDALFTPTMRSNAHGDDPERNDPEPRLNEGRSLIADSLDARAEAMARQVHAEAD